MDPTHARRTRLLNPREIAFFLAYFGPARGNGRLAAAIAGYRGDPNSLCVQGSRLLRGRHGEVIAAALRKQGCTEDAAAKAIAEALGALKLAGKSLEPDHPVRLRAAAMIFHNLQTQALADDDEADNGEQALVTDDTHSVPPGGVTHTDEEIDGSTPETSDATPDAVASLNTEKTGALSPEEYNALCQVLAAIKRKATEATVVAHPTPDSSEPPTEGQGAEGATAPGGETSAPPASGDTGGES